MHYKSSLAVIGSALLSHVSCAPAAAPDPTATVAQGVVIGTASPAVNKYLGIPFAVTPPERFLPPKAHPNWTGPLKAQKLSAACIQQFEYPKNEQTKTERLFNNPGGPAPPESEDCLRLNVFAPKAAKPGSDLPVMFWIYGGNLEFGTASLGYYDGSSFAENQNVIIVTHNYRTNVFGFSNSPEIPEDQLNAGFYDQRMALEWTHTNIANFGGDPDKITIFGESAGGYSVKQLLAFPPEPLNFRGAIMESEAASITNDGAKNWKKLQQALGCNTLACVQKAPASKIRSIVDTKALGFSPVEDGLTRTANVAPYFKSGKAAKVPFMIGTNQNEGRPFIYIFAPELDKPNANLTQFIQDMFPNDPALQAALETTYKNTMPYIAASDIITKAAFQCPAAKLAKLAQGEGHTVFRYLFNATFPNTQLFPEAGVWHSSEIPEVFGTYPGANKYGPQTNQEVQLSKYMQTAWAKFAIEPSVGPGWPEYGSKGNVGDLGGKVTNGEETLLSHQIDTECAIFQAYVDSQGL